MLIVPDPLVVKLEPDAENIEPKTMIVPPLNAICLTPTPPLADVPVVNVLPFKSSTPPFNVNVRVDVRVKLSCNFFSLTLPNVTNASIITPFVEINCIPDELPKDKTPEVVAVVIPAFKIKFPAILVD